MVKMTRFDKYIGKVILVKLPNNKRPRYYCLLKLFLSSILRDPFHFQSSFFIIIINNNKSFSLITNQHNSKNQNSYNVLSSR